MTALRIVCFGSSRIHPGEAAYEQAQRVGRVLAERKLSVLTGGYGGAMEAISRGSHKAGGRVLGVTTTIFTARTANPHLHEEFVETDYVSRMATLLRQGHGYLGLPGGLGTLSEWVTAWCLATIQQLPGPLWLFEDPWRPVVDALQQVPEIASAHLGHLRWVHDADDFARQLDGWIGARAESPDSPVV